MQNFTPAVVVPVRFINSWVGGPGGPVIPTSMPWDESKEGLEESISAREEVVPSRNEEACMARLRQLFPDPKDREMLDEIERKGTAVSYFL